MGKSIIRIVLLACFILPIQLVYAQSGVGIGTSSPNPNAALDIQSAANDKGILIPRLTSTERLAMNASLSATENGLLVFDSDLQEFFYWNNTIWTAISVIQDLQLVGNSLSITKNSTATVIDLSPFSGTNTDNQNLSSSSSGNNRTIDITGGTSTTFNVADNDNNAANEIQTISKAGATVTLSNGGGSFSVNDGDISSTNEIQNLSNTAAGTNRTLNISGGTGTTFSIADDDNSTTNEIQDLSTTAAGTNRNINITSGKGITISVADNDNNASNEIQNLSNTVAGTNRTINITGGTGTTFSIADNDNNASNEIQTLSFSSPNLSISGGNSVTIPNTFLEAFKAFFSIQQTFLKGIFKIPFDNIEYDINGTYDPGAGDYTVPVMGIYRISGMVSILPVGLSPINLVIVVNGVIVYQQDAWPTSASDSQFSSYLFDTEVLISKGDVVEFYINSSAGFTLDAGNTKSYIAGRLVVQL